MRVLHVASEIAPYAKTGGLADVLGALPAALARLKTEVMVVAPRYRAIDPDRFGLGRWLSTVPVPLGDGTIEVGVYEGTPPGGARVRLFFIDHPPSFDRDGLYGPPGGGDFPDNARRFTLLGRAALALAAHLGLWPDILHGHDWQAGPALLYARSTHGDLRPPRTVFTVHNLAFQGLFPESTVEELGFPRALYHPDGYEFYGQVSLLKAGLVLADRITTVSPSYAKEIQTPEQGCGLDGLLRARADRLVGILNGVDYEVWSPEHDRYLPAGYSKDALGGKRRCKLELQRAFGLPLSADTPLSGSVSRLTEQKGFDLLLGALPHILEGDAQVALLGTGDPELERALIALAARHPKKLAVRIGYDEALAHLIEAGSDLFLMPSRYEPCGLNQLYSLRYGTPPVVRATGGLDDTIVDYEPRSRSGTGYKFVETTAPALTSAWRRALHTYRETPSEHQALQRRGMAQDFSWAASARRYLELYDGLSR
ncbi:MAG TPA: glycogen synthase GlgA [Polyangia bacterium]